MKKLTITIETKGAAFEDENMNVEIARILQKLTDGVRENSYFPATVNDINGNKCGKVEIE